MLSLATLIALAPPTRAQQPILDEAAEQWVAATLKRMTRAEKIGQLLVPSLNSTFTSVDSQTFDDLSTLVRTLKIGGFHVFGAAEPMPEVLLNPGYGGTAIARRGDVYAAAALLNRLQRDSDIPLLNTADFEGGVGYILQGATRLPRAMAIAAARDPDLAYRAGKLAAEEGRSVGIHVNLYPVADVNDNPQNPVINIRSFGEDVAAVSAMTGAYIRGIAAGGMLSTAKHFPGHGDTRVDSHLALPVIDASRDRLDAIALPPFRAAIAAGVDAIMSGHIAFPAIDPAPLESSPLTLVPATLSRRILTDLLRHELQFDGLIVTDAMSMLSIAGSIPSDRAAALAVAAGNDLILQPPDPAAAFSGIQTAIVNGEIDPVQLDRSVERILRAKARMKLHLTREVELSSLDVKVGNRRNEQVATQLTERALTLVRDDRGLLPLQLDPTAHVLYVSVIDRLGSWREGAPSRTFLPTLWMRWANVTAIEVSDRTTRSEYDLIRTIGARADGIIVSIFARNALPSGQPELAPEQVALVQWLATQDAPFAATIFGNPYAAALVSKLPTLLLTYEMYDGMEAAVVRALAGEIPIGGRLPVSLPGMFRAGDGLQRAARRPIAGK